MDINLDWIDKKNVEQCEWAIRYLQKITSIKPQDRSNLTLYEFIMYAFNLINKSEHKEVRRLMMASWSQKKLANNPSDKKVSRQYRLDKKATNDLASISRSLGLNLNVTIEYLIEKEQKKRKSLKNITKQIKEEQSNLYNKKLQKLQEYYAKEANQLEEESLYLKAVLRETIYTSQVNKEKLRQENMTSTQESEIQKNVDSKMEEVSQYFKNTSKKQFNSDDMNRLSGEASFANPKTRKIARMALYENEISPPNKRRTQQDILNNQLTIETEELKASINELIEEQGKYKAIFQDISPNETDIQALESTIVQIIKELKLKYCN